MQKLRQLVVFIFISTVAYNVNAQDAAPADSLKNWDLGGIFNLNLNQVSLHNWSAGGVNSVSGGTFLDLHANYKTEKTNWANSLKMGYGLIEQQGMKTQKTDDFIEFNSDYSRKTHFGKHWYYAANLNFKTQFDAGYADNEIQDSIISKFLAPGYVTTSLGLNYIPSDVFRAHIAPVASKITIVNDEGLAAEGAYGVDPGNKVRYQWGAYSRLEFKKEVFTNVNVRSKMELFWAYVDDPESVDVNWEMLMDFKINKWLSTSLNLYLIYDDDINVPLEEDADGNVTKSGPRIQFKQVLGLGVNVKF